MTSADFIRTLRRDLLGPCGCAAGSRLLVGCSGGPDSTALLLGLCALQGELALELHVVHVDHGLRAESAAEGARVLALAAGLEVSAESVRVTVPSSPSRMAAAREARYEALLRVARERGARAVAVGHTRSDQAETVIMRLLGGAGLRGLAGMAPWRELDGEVALVRPLLRVGREGVEAFLRSAGIEASEDPTNGDRRFQRARVRHEVLPLLRRERGDLEGHLADLGEQLRLDADYLDGQAEAALRGLLGPSVELPGSGQGGLPGSGALVLPVAGLLALPQAISSRVIRRLLPPLSHRNVQDVLLLCRRSEGSASLDLPCGRIERRYGGLHLPPAPRVGRDSPVAASAPTDTVAVPTPGEYRLGDAAVIVEILPSPPTDPAPRRSACFDAGSVPFPLLLRRPRRGDRMRVRGMPGRKKLSDLFIDEKVPRSARADAVLLCRGDEVLWVAGLRAADSGAPLVDGAPCLVARLP